MPVDRNRGELYQVIFFNYILILSDRLLANQMTIDHTKSKLHRLILVNYVILP